MNYRISTRQSIWDRATPVEAVEAPNEALDAAIEDLRAALLDLKPDRPEIEVEPEEVIEPEVEVEVSTTEIARRARRRTTDVFALANAAIAAGVAREVGSGDSRRHVRWALERATIWLSDTMQ